MIPGIVAQASTGEGAPTDPHFANVVLLASAVGADGATTFIDESPSAHTLTAIGNAQVDTGITLFGKPTILLDHNGDSVNAADHDDWWLGDGDFTLECWGRIATLSTPQALLTSWAGTNGLRSWAWIMRTAANFYEIAYDADGNLGGTAVIDSAAQTYSTNQWYHFAVDRASNVHRLYRDGVMITKATNSVAAFNGTSPLRIGNQESSGLNNGFNGNMAEVRITKGVARYASDAGYTVPTEAYPRS